MHTVSPPSWFRRIGFGLIILTSPFLLIMAGYVLVTWPRDTWVGVAAAFSGHDVVQTADAEETGVTTLLLCLAILGLTWVLHLRMPERIAIPLAIYGMLLLVPFIALLGIGANYGLQALLALRGYGYCTYHVISTGKGSHVTYVYVKDSLPGGCSAAKAIFPPGTIVPDRREAFDLRRAG